MLRNTLIAATIASAAILGLASGEASAVPVSPAGAPPALDKAIASNVVPAQWRRYRRQAWYSHRYNYGPRYRYRYGRYAYYHGGWWYRRPWWNYPGVAVGIGPVYGGYYDNGYYDDGGGYDDGGYAGGGYAGGSYAGDAVADPHVQWCMNRYRSYELRTNTFLGYDGYRHPCNSPVE